MAIYHSLSLRSKLVVRFSAMKMEYLADGSPDCPLIRLYGFRPAEVLELRSLCLSLANRAATCIALHEQPGIDAIGGCELSLRIGDRDAGVHQSGKTRFDCTLTDEGWREVAGLAEPFCQIVEPNTYQWLNEDGDVSLLLSPNGKW